MPFTDDLPRAGDFIRVTDDVGSLTGYDIATPAARALAGSIVPVQCGGAYDGTNIRVECPLGLRHHWYLRPGLYARVDTRASPSPTPAEGAPCFRIGDIVDVPDMETLDAAHVTSVCRSAIAGRPTEIARIHPTRQQYGFDCTCASPIWVPWHLFAPPEPQIGRVSRRPPAAVRMATVTPLPLP